ncbi:MAG TPA: hypothetical protein VGU66_02335 [Candidatus Elarobacter sp.]|nr:hypothetical protein [Candidatus Elarobacter sp.]
MSTCILVSAFEGYIPAAQLTRRLIDRYWADHPPLWFCGAHIDDAAALPFRDDPKDWMAGVRSALRDLSAMGFERVYLILADLGPIDQCHAQHLNHTIPQWLTELDAVYISIRGWDHRRNSSGRSLGRRYLSLQRQSAWYWPRFALHPALWRIDVLATLLDVLMKKITDHSAWAFEIQAGNLYSEIPAAWNEGTYRVCGRLMSATPIPAAERWARHVVDGLVRWIDLTFNHKNERASWPPNVARIMNPVLQTTAVYFQGPYPVYFQGFLTRGRLNRPLVHYLRRTGRDELLREIEMACPPP